MSDKMLCPDCGSEIPANAPAGQCPKCMLNAGFETGELNSAVERENEPTVNQSGFTAPSPEALARFFPQFEIVELLGKGGMGAVYKARQPNLDRHVALKILPPEVGKDPAFAERFMREARALAMLSHSCIVAVYDFGEADGLYYFVMEYVDGANLRQTIEQGGLTPSEALTIVPQICEALQFAHDEGVVHRDIKPENILIDKRGRVKIADFGLAKLLGRNPKDEDGKEAPEKPFTLTGTHQVMGTLRYMAPEQMQGSSSVDHRADIYSLGVVFYEMLTGELPMGRFEPPSKKVRIDVRLDEVVLRSLESAPDRRYQHASDIKTDVDSIVGDTRYRAPSSDAAEFESSVRRRLKVPANGLMVAGVANLLASASLVLLLICVNLGFSIPGLDFSDQYIELAEVFFFLAIALVSLLLGIVLLLGSSRMRDLQSYPIAMSAAVASVLPLALGFPNGLPFGIRALLVLSRKDVKVAFAGESDEQQQRKKTVDSAVGGMMAIGLALGAAVGAAMENIAVFTSVGMIIGILVGSVIDSNKRRNAND